MERRILGGTGMSVSAFALGTMMLGASGNTDHDESVRIIHTAMDAGINFIDTADVYSSGESEIIVGKALKECRRDDVVLATKFAMAMGPDGNQRGGSRKWIMRAVEDSLRRLGTDYIDLYQMHRFDPVTDLDETLSALSDLVRAGKVRAFGSSLFHAEQIVEAQWVAERRGHRRFRSEQPPYNILLRGIESNVLPTAQHYGLGVLTFGPLASGWLSGRADPTTGHRNAGAGKQLFDQSDPGNRAKAQVVKKLSKLADEAGLPMPYLATAFVRSHPVVTSVLIGPRTPEHLAGLLAGADVILTDDILDRIDEIVPPGTDLNRNDLMYVPSVLGDKRARRRTR
ncbi:aldo/keto reductase [Streptomyces spinosisporus]|jgi:aryl-alcohol dehydrogenase-like predicted oxidoreductase|uniref:Aldo/keto reductase n=1 Tax=Streptomyces spinosisporus TaxID=2927582 RepID=A0ABS9XWB9_9ACTN|nr:aldo/keto reductase [Streptomyces spinosisporus]MCI3246377.1 aldo/keto reductase [Streptomyces spinosisporus]